MPNLSPHRQHPALVALGEAVRAARTAKGWTQEELAHRAGLNFGHVGRIERGDNEPALLTLLKLSQALDTSLWSLIKKSGL